MRKIVLYSAASLDSFIARKDGSIDWLEAPDLSPGGEDFGYQRFYGSVDTTLMGYKTYKQVLEMEGPFPFSGKTNYVFSRTRRRRWHKAVTPVTRDIPGFVRKLKRRKGKNIWLVGGSQINTLLLNHGLIDRIILTIVPVAIGTGIPLFGSNAKPKRFRPAGRRVYPNGFVQLTWKK